MAGAIGFAPDFAIAANRGGEHAPWGTDLVMFLEDLWAEDGSQQ